MFVSHSAPSPSNMLVLTVQSQHFQETIFFPFLSKLYCLFSFENESCVFKVKTNLFSPDARPACPRALACSAVTQGLLRVSLLPPASLLDPFTSTCWAGWRLQKWDGARSCPHSRSLLHQVLYSDSFRKQIQGKAAYILDTPEMRRVRETQRHISTVSQELFRIGQLASWNM